MAEPVRDEREAAFRADVARLVQAMHHHLPADHIPEEIVPLIGPVRHLAGLLDADAPAEHLAEAALAVVDLYDWPNPEAAGDEGLLIDPAILAAVERLRDAIDAMDMVNGDMQDTENGPDPATAGPA